MSELNFKEWLKKYSTEKVVDFKDYLNSRDFELLKILDVIVEDKVYTLQEYDQILFCCLWTAKFCEAVNAGRGRKRWPI